MPGLRYPHLTFSNVMSTIAVLLSLSGAAYAFSVPRDSVRSEHIVDGQVQRADLEGNSVASGKVADGSLLRRDFRAGAVPVGSDAYYAFNNNPGIYQECGFGGCGAEPVVAQVAVPPGSYVAMAKVVVNNSDKDFRGHVYCVLSAGGNTDEADIHLEKAVPFTESSTIPASQVVSLLVAHRFTAPGTVRFTCGNRGSIGSSARHAKLIATRVESIHRP